MDYKVKIVRTVEELLALRLEEHDTLVADVETYGLDPADGKLLGVALAPLSGTFADGSDAAYVVVQEYMYKTSTWKVGTTDGYLYFFDPLVQALDGTFLVGHNYCYDRGWLDSFFDVDTVWHADTRIMWHMADRPLHSKGYGLKDAQVDVLGWKAKGDEALRLQVEARGGKLKKGDHYLADTEVLGYYAGLDAISTAQLYAKVKPHLTQHEGQWELMQEWMRFAELLDRNTRLGVMADSAKLSKQVERLTTELAQARADLVRHAAPYVRKMEEAWRDHRAAKYASERHRAQFLADPTLWKRFNPGSDKQKRELFYGAMRLPVVETVKPRKDRVTGRKVYSTTPSVDKNAVRKALERSGRQDLAPAFEAYARAEKTETLLKNFAAKWLKVLKGERIHPPFNPCGTVSYRISGRAPYFLNLPFDEAELMSCFSCDEGSIGIHWDLSAVEPSLTAHYSQDPHLLKTFRDGLGDVYLDLALTLFPGDSYLKQGYDPNVPCTTEVKERFKRQRKVAKVVQLAVQYTGTGYTVSKSLGCSVEEADVLVAAYWKHFERVGRMNDAIRVLHTRRGHLRNVVGRVLRVPSKADKDVPNRFFQSGGHDVLVKIVLKLYDLCEERGIDVRPVLVDCHDSSSNQCPVAQVEQLEQAVRDAVAHVNTQLGMTVPLKIELKRFSSLAGLKADEVDLSEEEETEAEEEVA